MNSFTDHVSFCLPGELAEKYTVRSCLKYSEQSATYLLRAKNSGRPYLLKTAVDPVFAGLLANEKKILEFIHETGDSIYTEKFPVPVYFGTSRTDPDLEGENAQNIPLSDMTLYIRTFVEGSTLEDLCETNFKKPGLPPDQALDYIISITELLHFLHTLDPPLIHRDIKPQNVVIDSEGGCHLIDFGISRFYQNAKRNDTFIMGTKLTAPPEQFGYQQTDTRSDLYSLGILLLYCITGEYEVNEGSLAELDQPLQLIIRKATAFSPDKRYQTTAELLPDLLSARYPKVWNTVPAAAPRKYSVFSIAACVLLTLNLVLLCILLYQNQESTDTPQGQILPASTETNDSNNNSLELSSEYHFREPLIEEAVRKQLDLATGPVTLKDLEKVTELHIFGLQIFSSDDEVWFKGQYPWIYDTDMRESGLYEQKGTISSLEDILYMPNLDTLSLYRQQISDISLLEGTAIRHLGLGYNPLTDLTPLEGNTAVVSLNLACLDLTDTALFATLPNLARLDLSDTRITDLSGLEQCQIEYLNLFGLTLNDYGKLQKLPYLQHLILDHLSPDIIDAMAGMPLTRLEFFYSNTLKLDELSVFPKLQYLFFRGNHFEPLLCEAPTLDNLEELCLQDVTIEDFGALSSLTALKTLHTYGAVCDTYKGLDKLPSLKTINCTQEQYEKIRSLYPDQDYIYFY